MNCEEIRAKLSLYLDHMLSQKDAQMVCRHLNSCQSCGKEVRELSEISRLLGQLPQKPVPDVFWQRMDQALHEERKEKTKRTRRGSALFSGKKRLWRTVAGAAAVFLVCVISYSMYSDHLSLPHTGTGERASQQWKLDEKSQTDPTAPLNQSDGQKNGQYSENQWDQASGAGNSVGSKEKEDGADGEDSKAAASPSAPKPAAAASAPKPAAASSAPKSAAASSAPRSAASAEALEPFAASAAPAGGPESENLMRSRGFSMEASAAADLDGAVSNLADAINQKDLKKMEQSVNLAGFADQLEDRAKVALSFYQTIFGSDPISWEFVKEEPQQKNRQQKNTSLKAAQQKEQSNVRQYSMSNENRTLRLSAVQKDGRTTLQEGILQYSYGVDQAMAGAAYQLKSYSPQNETGCPEFTLLLKESPAGTDQTVTFVGCDGKVSRKDGTQPAPVKDPDKMEGK